MQAAPDGYTLLASAFNTAVMPLVLKAATFNPETDLTVMEMKARQMAWAVKRTQRLWRQAWDEAHQPKADTP